MKDTVTKKKLLNICLLTGALGSGKTTLLNKLLSSTKLRGSMVLINEFGDIGLDHEIVREVTEDVLLLSSGCLCCSLKGDLRDELTGIVEDLNSGKLPPVSGPIIIETTGLADPIPILKLINSDEVLQHHMGITNLITVVDAINIQTQVEEFPEVANQVAFADILAISKTDLASIVDQSSSNTIIDQMNPLAKRLELKNEDSIGDLISSITSLKKRSNTIPTPKRKINLNHGEEISSFVFEIERTVKADDFFLWIQLLVQSQGERLLRMKGIISFEDGTYYVHSTGYLFYPREPVGEIYKRNPGKLIFISRGLTKESIEKGFRAICEHQTLTTETVIRPEKELMPARFKYLDIKPALRKKLNRIFSEKQIDYLSPYLFWGVHNPWSLSSNYFDSWAILEICEDEDILLEVRKVLGNNVNLIGSEIVTEKTPWLDHQGDISIAQEASYIPVEAERSVACRIPLFEFSAFSSDSKIILHNLSQTWSCNKNLRKWAHLVLYFSDSNMLFNRSKLHPANINGVIQRPLANIAAMPIWLVSGQDGSKNNYVTGYDRPKAEWLSNSSK
ncbi:MAG: GTP-binding protein [Paracoccaceae bacterium]|nr:GTP-binding protein [Paracoccaceae bacterium]